MKSVVALASAMAMLVTVAAHTQEIRADEARDKVFGWMKVYDFKAATEPLTVDHRVYSTAQLSVTNTFANWIQQSYVPVGGLGDVIRSVAEKLNNGNQNTKSLPQSGAYAPGAGADRQCRLRLGSPPRSELTLQGMDMIIGYGIVMLGVCLLGCVVPTRRALNIEPTIALRTE